ncbi:transcription factor FapR [Staphylococcus devriesei]|uniref:Transcription factor FapR n=1 Tax=Staphylococcus devriesei TaxID=586733 RepID=A0A2K4DLQ5_9STAP|nr:transcription factor FapR [Staphylococcus devriesei]MCE5089501.1 transcription factor FapR [Staphylococcus devriesei]MCE5096250.1 transcription factor FapR [Staphylococcus devriesei]PNZ87698.1 transcription factor FapR [Staphylococcus devriesei]PTF04599.1 transcription factor FapR [Staphylococcus devriesei]PTF14440.1 transcription factor FapR [Staphylococcus devriesei]
MKLKKTERRQAIQKAIDSNPFITDSELCEKFEVSIQTIRLDRTNLNIPELRKRIKLVAEQNYEQIRALEASEVIGDLIQVEPNKSAQSIIDITEDSVFMKTQIVRGHVLFAQANSLCVALIHNSTVLTQESNIEFIEKVKLHDTVRAEAIVLNKTMQHYVIEVNSFVKDTLVFKGTFKMFYISEERING